MKRIIITPEFEVAHELKTLRDALAIGMMVHIRKKDIEETRRLLKVISFEDRKQVKVHRFVELAIEYQVGIHLSSKQSAPENWTGPISKSCHSFVEVESGKELDYVFLSPIFDSISKEGYSAAFSEYELSLFLNSTSTCVIALGGITLDRVSQVEEMGFDGYAILGDFWNRTLEERSEYLKELSLEKCA